MHLQIYHIDFYELLGSMAFIKEAGILVTPLTPACCSHYISLRTL
jgi:hypothetical protein